MKPTSVFQTFQDANAHPSSMDALTIDAQENLLPPHSSLFQSLQFLQQMSWVRS